MNKRKVALTIISILIAVCVLLSFSYAIYIISPSNTHNIAVTANIPSCAGITLNNDTKITLTGDRAAPISDSKALSSENYRYSFTVSNGCSSSATMKVALALGSASTMPEGTIKYAIYESTGSIPSSGTFLNTNTKVLTNQIISEVTDVTNDTLSIGYEILSTTLATNTSKTYYVYIWIDENEGGLGNNTTIDKSFIGHLIVSDYETLGDNAIAFSINGTSYHGYESMTWQEWVNSSFNTDGYVIINNNVYNSDGSYYINVASSTSITKDNEYALVQAADLLADKIVVGQSGSGEVVNEGGGLRYEGANPNNYVCFQSSCTNDTLYRIIGKFTEMVDTNNDGIADTNKEVIKVIKNTSIGDYPWDDGSLLSVNYSSRIKLVNNAFDNAIAAPSYCDNINGRNNWATSSLKQYLNNNFVPPVNSILTTRWYTKGYNYANYTVSQFSNYERNGQKSVASYADYVDAKVGLIYPSDYGYAASSSSCPRTTNISDYYNSGCNNQDWLKYSEYQWTITPSTQTESTLGENYVYAFVISTDGFVIVGEDNCYRVNMYRAIRPSFYLDTTNTYVYFGNGSSSSPYILGQPSQSTFSINGITYNIYDF